MNKQYVALLLVASMVCSYGCKRDVMAPGPSVPVDGRQKFVGMYDVYDTIGNWLYEMAIIKHNGNGTYDSLFINGWGGEFDFYIQHDKEDASNYLNLFGWFGIVDHSGHRWALFREYDTLFNNTLVADTIRMSYLKDNIAFYVADGVPYFRQSYREYAVKREEE